MLCFSAYCVVVIFLSVSDTQIHKYTHRQTDRHTQINKYIYIYSLIMASLASQQSARQTHQLESTLTHHLHGNWSQTHHPPPQPTYVTSVNGWAPKHNFVAAERFRTGEGAKRGRTNTAWVAGARAGRKCLQPTPQRSVQNGAACKNSRALRKMLLVG